LTKAGEIHVAAESSRSQEGNRQDALARLREMLVAAMREPKPRRKTKPSAGARRRRLEAKRRRGQVKAMRRGGGE
jgi:ribosome-associated protein